MLDSRARRTPVTAVVLAATLALLSSCRAPIEPDSPASTRPVRTPNPKPAPASLAHAHELLRELQAEPALKELERLVRANPGDALAGLALAQAGVEFDRVHEVSAVFADLRPDHGASVLAARLGLARLAYARYEASGDEREFTAGETQLQNVLALDAEQAHALALAVLLYLLRAELRGDKHAPQARAICQAHDAAHPALAASCGEEAWRRGDPTRGRALYAHATEADPEHHGAWLRWGARELELGDPRTARSLLERATRSPWPSLRISAHATLGVALDRLADTHAAIAAYRSARDLAAHLARASPPELSFNLALALERVAEREADIDDARELLEDLRDDATLTTTQRLQLQRANTLLDARAPMPRSQPPSDPAEQQRDQ